MILYLVELIQIFIGLLLASLLHIFDLEEGELVVACIVYAVTGSFTLKWAFSTRRMEEPLWSMIAPAPLWAVVIMITKYILVPWTTWYFGQ